MSTQGQWRGEVDGLWYGPVTAGGPSVVNLAANLTGGGSVDANVSALANLAAGLTGLGSVDAGLSSVGGSATVPPETPRYSQAIEDHAHWKQLREEDDVLLALLQQFVMEEA
jgi:hypothetical protein